MDKKLLFKLSRMVLKFREVTINDKTYMIDGDITVGAEIVDENGEAIQDGEYIVEGIKVTIVNGVVTEAETIEIEDEPEVLEEQTEPEVQEPEKDEKDLRIEELEGLLKDRDAIIEELNREIEELKQKIAEPAAESIEEKMESEKEVQGAMKYFQK